MWANIYGIEWDGPIPFEDDHTVDVDPPPQLLCQEDYHELVERVHPLDNTSQYGIELYTQSIEFVLNKISHY